VTAGELAPGRIERRTPDQARVGWRYWRLVPGPRLRSVSQRGFTWEPGRPMVARCAGAGEAGHDVPAAGCACGLHASPDVASLQAGALCLAPGPLVVGEVSLWGTVVVDDHGYRGRYAYPRRLEVVRESLPEHSLDGVVAGLGAYRVPVDTTSLEAAVGPASATIMGFLAMSGGESPPAG
jgi:hypothetical protein